MSNISILYSSNGLVAVNKPPGVNVHAAPGPGSTVLRELAQQMGGQELVLIHRLDKDASGVLVLAETTELAAEVQRTWDRTEKTYLALCEGVPANSKGVIDAPILENQTEKPERLVNALRYFSKEHPGVKLPPPPVPRTSAVHPAGRESQTEYSVLEAFKHFSLLEIRPKQGRMHQIRLHLMHLGSPLAVDALYGKRKAFTERDAGGTSDAVLLNRMPLHAAKLIFPFRNERIEVNAPPPDDIQLTLTQLKKFDQI